MHSPPNNDINITDVNTEEMEEEEATLLTAQPNCNAPSSSQNELQIQTPSVIPTVAVQPTERGQNGSGSTGTNTLLSQGIPRVLTPPLTEFAPSWPTIYPVLPIEKPFDIFFSHDPFDNTMKIDTQVKGNHPTLGILSTYCPYCQCL
jgi:hypothetical protein